MDLQEIRMLACVTRVGWPVSVVHDLSVTNATKTSHAFQAVL